MEGSFNALDSSGNKKNSLENSRKKKINIFEFLGIPFGWGHYIEFGLRKS
jgi:hypothetical protein